ncbi:MAG TPA: hypothetical protein VNF75_08755 [Candidatus Dormibacteraeota bacterium]|nr:hypothetical protein [Candidatus Dormibacteraeota bacterium]
MPTSVVILFRSPRTVPLVLEFPDLALALPLKVLVRRRGTRWEVFTAGPRELLKQHGFEPPLSAQLDGRPQLIKPPLGG